MRILLLSTSDLDGGASIAAFRLHLALRAQNVSSVMLVQHKLSEDNAVIGPTGRVQTAWARIRPTIDSMLVQAYQRRFRAPFGINLLPNPGLIRQIHKLNPDVVHLHWVCGGFLPIEMLTRIGKPLVWSLHDMWPFTGGCHYCGNCHRYQRVCIKCPVLNSHRRADLSHLVFQRKQKALASIRNLSVVGLSRWIMNCSTSSRLLSSAPTLNFPNCIDTACFQRTESKAARLRFGLPIDAKLLLFAAARPTWDPRKGWRQLLDALNHVIRPGWELVMAGAQKSERISCVPLPVHNVGQLKKDADMAALYSACDLTVVPSAQENLSNTIMESMSCGTPVVAFAIGGNSDLIDHRSNGYLAHPEDPRDLAWGMEWILENGYRWQELSRNARFKVDRTFRQDLVAKQYIHLYQGICTDSARM